MTAFLARSIRVSSSLCLRSSCTNFCRASCCCSRIVSRVLRLFSSAILDVACHCWILWGRIWKMRLSTDREWSVSDQQRNGGSKSLTWWPASCRIHPSSIWILHAQAPHNAGRSTAALLGLLPLGHLAGQSLFQWVLHVVCTSA